MRGISSWLGGIGIFFSVPFGAVTLAHRNSVHWSITNDCYGGVCCSGMHLSMRNKFLRNQLAVAAGAVTGTSMMTLYSYLVSKNKNKNFKEPVLLGQMTQRLTPWTKRKHSIWFGWVMHYLAGLLFAENYASFFSIKSNTPNLSRGLVFGGLSGIAAILIWKFTLDHHPLPHI